MDKVLVTGGSAGYKIDDVRKVGNIFKGRTAAEIARRLAQSGYDVTLLTSDPQIVEPESNLLVLKYGDFYNLKNAMQCFLSEKGRFDALVHSAAIADYKPNALYEILGKSGNGDGTVNIKAREISTSGKVPSGYDRLILELEQGENLAQMVRSQWGFTGPFFMFKMERGITDDELVKRGLSRVQRCNADGIVTNCLEWMSERAILVSGNGSTQEVSRADLPQLITDTISNALTYHTHVLNIDG